ncbi:MAG: N-acetylmuramoyl-L-alanine amidase [Actinomycetota bacterium]|nr:N-acetylmuramoyl-L-alanine amidase [Actinomycetota bacterium]
MRARFVSLLVFTLVLGLVPLPALAGPSDSSPATVSRQLTGLVEDPDVSGPGQRSSVPTRAPIPFGMVGFELPVPRPDAPILFRTSQDGKVWSDWEEAEDEPNEGPDPASSEARQASESSRFTAPIWVGKSLFLQVSADGLSPEDVTAHVIDSEGLSRSLPQRVLDNLRRALSAASPPAAEAAASRPRIVSRRQWGADERLRSGPPDYASGVDYGIIHHTASPNGYACSQAPAVLRGIYHFHTQTRGWSDIGYNLLVDRCGVVYEGRAGGVDRPVIGAHAAGFNTRSFGIAVIGELTGSVPTAAYEAAVKTIAWKFDIHDIDPDDKITVTSRGSSKYAEGSRAYIWTLSGHRDVGHTECPGDALYLRLPEMRKRVDQRMSTGGGLIRLPLGGS